MNSVDGALAHALDLLERGETAGAQVVLAELLGRWRANERERLRRLNDARHEIGNALAIAQASVEAMLDGVVGITDQRLNRIREILSNVSASMYALTSCDDLGGETRP